MTRSKVSKQSFPQFLSLTLVSVMDSFYNLAWIFPASVRKSETPCNS